MTPKPALFFVSRLTKCLRRRLRPAMAWVLLVWATPWVAAAPAHLTESEARHFLLRTGFAPTREEIQAITGQSAQHVVEQATKAARHSTPTTPVPSFTQSPASAGPGATGTPEERQAYRYQQGREGIDIKAWWIAEMMVTTAPLQERMTLFWHNHFATSQLKVTRSIPMWAQHQLLRRHALGNFGQLVHHIAKDPAMLIYLDGANSRREAPNENFAREVMELFVLGEASQGGGYTEQDIKEAARAFTGWSVDPQTLRFRLRPGFHDTGMKTVLGQTGTFDGDAVLDILLAQNASGEFIVRKLWQEFVSTNAPSADNPEIRRLAHGFRQSGYDIAGLMKNLLLSDAFWHTDNRAVLVKSPVELLVGMARQLQLPTTDAFALAARSALLGQNLLAPPNVKGWPGNLEWINTTSWLARQQFAEALFAPAAELPDPAMAPRPLNAMQRQNLGFNPAELQALGRDGIVRLVRASAQVRLDVEPWLARQGMRSDVEPSALEKRQLVQALLAAPPVHDVAEGTVARNWLRALITDPAYQLK